MRAWLKRAVRVGLVFAPLVAAGACQTFHRTAKVGGEVGAECGPDGDCPGHPPKVCKNPSMMALGHDLDHLDRHIDWFGSAVAKVPDVWGQARLTQHREQFEKLMDPTSPASKLEFTAGLQGSLARSDQAFFAQATALSFAAQPLPPVIGSVSSGKSAPAPLVPTSQTVVAVTGTDPNTKDQTTTTTNLAPTPTPPTPPFTPTPPDDPKNLLSNPDTAISQNTLLTNRGIGFGPQKDQGIGLEPTLILAQKKRWLDYLNQLRRENEGDDTADSPGYALHLIRVPVSILPGKKTDEGYGAEVTMTLNTVLSPELLPMTYRNLVTNDLVKTLGFPLTRFLDIDRSAAADQKYLTDDVRELVRSAEWESLHPDTLVPVLPPASPGAKVAPPALSPGGKMQAGSNQKADQGYARLRAVSPGMSRKDVVRSNIRRVVTVPSLSFTNAGQDRQPFATSQLIDVYGPMFAFEIAYGANQALQREMGVSGYAHLPSVQSYLREEVRAAYQFLALPTSHCLWDAFCTPELVALIRDQQWELLDARRQEFRNQVMVLTGSKPLDLVPVTNPDETPKVIGGKLQYQTNPVHETRQTQVTAALAWGILVDSALLTDRLMRDMKETAAAKGKPLAGCAHWLPYYLPDPPPDARAAFTEYVGIRWPVHVFALDPYVQEQNIADQLSTRREMQLALSIAFTNGFIGARSLTKYTRRLEADYETIDLNRTQVGFSHGENVFGWRFYPRYQTPDTESNAKVLIRDLFIGGPNKNALLRQRRLEPGPRECVAVVMMPTFVPFATLDVNTNWFGLANPKHKVLDHTQALKLSRTVQAIKSCGPGAAADANCYRDGEFSRLLRRAEQLEARLPTQTLTVQLPAANTLGGFEMFSNGTTDLAPDLYGWYGAPGVTATGTTTLFLVGDHFSPLNNKVVIGNQPATTALLSRQVMQATVSGPLLTVTDPATKRVYAQAQVATPYGVTRELLIPVADAKQPDDTAAKEGYSLDGNQMTIKCNLMRDKDGVARLVFQKVTSDPIEVKWDDATGSVPVRLKVEFKFKVTVNGAPCMITVPVDKLVVTADGNKFTLDDDPARLYLTQVAKGLVDKLNGLGLMGLDPNPLTTGLKTDAVMITPQPDDDKKPVHAVKAKKSANQLEVTFELEAPNK